MQFSFYALKVSQKLIFDKVQIVGNIEAKSILLHQNKSPKIP